MKLQDVLKIMKDVPDYPAFLTVDELNASSHKLAKKYPGVVELMTIGESRRGEKIEALKIGSGSKNALMFAMPHPNEPIGSMMLEFWSERLAQDSTLLKQLDFTWYLIKCIDVDSTRLNEGWFKPPFSLTSYARHYYRPPSQQQVEWTFPVDYKTLHFHAPMPETTALMNLIEKIKPDFMYSLHNAGFGGVYAYISNQEPAFYPDFYEIVKSQGLPLHLGEPETPFAQKFSDAIFGMLGVEDMYEFFAKNSGGDPAPMMKGGTSSFEYACLFKRPTYLVCEMPYFYNPAIVDTSPSDVVRRNAILSSIKDSRKRNEFIQEQYDRVKGSLTVMSPFRQTVETNLEFISQYLAAQENWAKGDPSLDAKATVAEKFDNLSVHNFYELLSLGIFVRLLETQIEESGETELLKSILMTVLNRFENDAAQLEGELKYEVIPIRKLAGVQLGVGLLLSEYIHP